MKILIEIYIIKNNIENFDDFIASNIISGKLHVVRRIYNWINDSPNDLKYPSSLLNKKYPMQLKVTIFINKIKKLILVFQSIFKTLNQLVLSLLNI